MGSDGNLDAQMCFPKARSEQGNVTITSEPQVASARMKVEKASGAFFEIHSFDWSASANGSSGPKKKRNHQHKNGHDDDGDLDSEVDTGGMRLLGARCICVNHFTIAKTIDTASMGLFRAATTKDCYWSAAQVLFRKMGPDGKPFEYLKYQFTDVRVDEISWSISGEPKETVKFAFDAVTIFYSPQTDEGQKDTVRLTANWSHAKSKSGVV